MRHLLGIRHLQPAQIEELLQLASDFKSEVKQGRVAARDGQRVIGMLFFEGSTRTRVSFEQAAHYVGFRSVNFSQQASSVRKGETLKDTVLTLRYEGLEALVIRHPASGAPDLAARYFGGPVINAGDGQHEHPTQALGDALTILERKGKIAGLTVAIVGDVKHSRVARSNAWLLSKLGAEVRFVGPRTLIPTHTGMLPATVCNDLAEGIAGAHVVMGLRLQKERMAEGTLNSINEYTQLYQLNRDSLRYAAEDCLIMHPGPLNRGVELEDQVADGENSAIHHQVENGVFVRMAVLRWVFGSQEPASRQKHKRTAAVSSK